MFDIYMISDAMAEGQQYNSLAVREIRQIGTIGIKLVECIAKKLLNTRNYQYATGQFANWGDAAAGWDVTYKINGTETKVDGNLTVKVIQTATGDNVPSFWAQNPESGEVKSLTVDILYIPPFVEENVDLAGTWNDNPVALKAGKYDLVFVTFEGSKGMALIAK